MSAAEAMPETAHAATAKKHAGHCIALPFVISILISPRLLRFCALRALYR
jgi:hypothetical protein